jgi:molybdopterin-containing oxidoreductase family iron-sulfur binding subunit
MSDTKAEARSRTGSTDPALDGSPLRREQVTRRRFLRLLGAGAAVAGVGGIAARARTIAALPAAGRGDAGVDPAQSSDEVLARHQWVMVFDLRRCDGCERCTEACVEMHGLPEDQPWIKVLKLHDAAGQTYYMPRPCMQCERPPCVRVCPVKATFRAADGVTLVDQDRCIGCRMCMAACPYDARTFTWTEPPPPPPDAEAPTDAETPRSPEFPVPQQLGTAGKCVLCVHDLRSGRLPACVRRCHNDAIYVGDLNADVALNGKETVRLSTLLKDNDAFRLREELGTRPRVFYIPGHGQLDEDD